MAWDSIRVGIIGTGRISDLHVIEYLNNPSTVIAAVCDSARETALSRARAWGVADDRVFSDAAALLKLADINLVEILLPHHLHKTVALQALAAGKAVSLQKPMCTNITDAQELSAAAEASGLPFKIFENFIFYPPVVKAKALIDEGAIGRLLSIRIKSNPGKSSTAWHVPPASNAWRQNLSASGGGPLVFDDGHHKFALAWFFMGQAEQVHAWIGKTQVNATTVYDAPAMMSFKFADNRYGSFEVVYSPDLEIRTRHYAQDDRVELTGTRGVLWINKGHGSLGRVPPLVLYRDGELTAFSNLETGWETSFVHSTQHFIHALQTGRPPKLTGAEGLEILKLTLAAQKSALLNRAVAPSEL